jgi:hypothetical protein
MLDFD